MGSSLSDLADFSDFSTDKSDKYAIYEDDINPQISNDITIDDHQPIDETKDSLNKVRNENPQRLIIGHININSLRNKFLMLEELVKNKVDILLISETKLDDSFPMNQFRMEGYSTPFRRDRNNYGGGIILLIREDIPAKILNEHLTECDIEHFFVEVNLRSKKWLISCSYNPNVNSIQKHLSQISRGIDFYSTKYENFIFLGDFNAEITNSYVENFCGAYGLKSLIKVPTCYKNPLAPKCIDLILTNRPKSFQNSNVYETGLSDFHKLTFTVLKMFYDKQKPQVVNYRNYKKFDNNHFRHDLLKELSLRKIPENHLEKLKDISSKVLNKLAPVKKKYVRSNQGSFMNKALRKAIMTRSILLNNFRKNRSESNRLKYRKQRNYCVKLLKKTKKLFYKNLDVRHVVDNRLFWRTIKPSFSDKIKKNENITLVEKQDIISDDCEIAGIFNEYFGNIIGNLGIKYDDREPINSDPVMNAISLYEKHPSIIKIKSLKETSSPFKFIFSNVEEVEEEINKLNVSKAIQSDDIPTKVIKENVDIFAKYVTEAFNKTITTSTFPDFLKNADIKPIWKKDSRSDKSNYRPVSILPNLSKIFEKILYKQMERFSDLILSKKQCGFRKGFNAENCLLVMIEKWRQCLDQGGVCSALLTDLSKAFDSLPHSLLIAKIHAYGFDMPSLRLIHSYLTNRTQRVKINNSYSQWSNI